MNKYSFIIFFGIVLLIFNSCKSSHEKIEVAPEAIFMSVDKTTETMIHDIFSPPQASRIYTYPNIIAYEILCQNQKDYQSLAGQIKGFNGISPADKSVNLPLAALWAHIQISKKLVFTQEPLQMLEDSLAESYESLNEDDFENAKDYVNKILPDYMKWIDSDNYSQTRTMPKFSIELNNPSRWQPTPPAYMDGVEPHWNKIRPMLLDSASQFQPIPPPTFSLEPQSQFYKELREVYDESQRFSKEGDSSEEVQIAQFWDCNPYVSVSKGHFMFATKKITPGGHWMGIAMIACKKNKSDIMHSVFTLTQVSMGLFDGFISCWDEKYRSNLIRPETLINQHIDENWKPILQTPPFPEYTSGHSVVSAASATILSSIFGENFSFEDTSEIPFGLPVRNFNSFMQAAEEAAISRMYGGIHYRAAIEQGLKQGKAVGNNLITKVKMHTAP